MTDQPQPIVSLHGRHTEQGASLAGWQPIETAPLGVDILVSMTHSLGDGEWENMQWVDYRINGAEWPIYWSRIDIPFPPTHWMPLPPPPA